ncbi:prolyl oligopeptidase family serine peptidase [Nocardioides sp. zg-ZUI104]|uniref:alpha/beta hydrolase family protein n=1 Tax=Nocardioides faecalis TaxID=2803858 RepID=UPI001BCB53C9|nr:prolyl oligopeptidase family serine peptidase [Nocardioides faecalis]MBS4752801.1 prolyl oligopeptidase family serine peptidase [Nocardioides faecalis]
MTTRTPYGDDPSQYAELTLPDGAPRGVAVLVHGGFWKPEHGIEHAQPLVPSLVEAGWATWAIEYRRGTGAADTLADVRAAIAACPVEHPVRVAIGHSAGGHLAAWAATQQVGLTHVVSQAGVLDLRAAHDAGLGGGAVARFLGHPPGEADAGVDPIRQVPLAVPLWCVHGRADDVVPLAQSQAYVAAATAAGGAAELIEVAGDHFDVIDPASEAWARVLGLIEQLSRPAG